MVQIEQRLTELGLRLPDRCDPRGNFLPYVISQKLVFMAGQVCEWNGDLPYQGPVLSETQQAPDGLGTIDIATSYKAAEICALNLLFHLRNACEGDFARVKRIVRVGGYVNCLPGFDRSPAVINGASDLLIKLFGESGRHARTAVGVAGLPANASVEVDAVFALN